MYEQGKLDFLDEITASRHSTNPVYPNSRGTNWCRNCAASITDLPWIESPSTTQTEEGVCHGHRPEVFPKILHGGETPASSWIPPGMLAHNPKIGLRFNPDQARRFCGKRISERKRIAPIVLGYDNEEDQKLVAEAVQAMWQKNLEVVVGLRIRNGKFISKKLQNDPFWYFAPAGAPTTPTRITS